MNSQIATKKNVLAVLFALAFIIIQTSAWACTSAIITGKVTPNGKPLLWKHRDTGQEQNRIDILLQENMRFWVWSMHPTKEALRGQVQTAPDFPL